MASPTIEAAPTGHANSGPAVSTAAFTTGGTFSTSNVLCAVIVYQNPALARTVSSVASSGTGAANVGTWTKRSAQAFGAALSHMGLEVWTATMSGGSFSGTVTATLSGATDSATVFVLGIVSTNTPSSPFDVNVSLPSVTTANAALTAPVFSTSQADDLAFVVAMNVGAVNATSGAWTAVDSTSNASGALQNFRAHIFSNSYSSTQTGTTTDIAGTSSDWIVYTDAFTADAAPAIGGKNPTALMMGV